MLLLIHQLFHVSKALVITGLQKISKDIKVKKTSHQETVTLEWESRKIRVRGFPGCRALVLTHQAVLMFYFISPTLV